jgi:hypothetical protein
MSATAQLADDADVPERRLDRADGPDGFVERPRTRPVQQPAAGGRGDSPHRVAADGNGRSARGSGDCRPGFRPVVQCIAVVWPYRGASAATVVSESEQKASIRSIGDRKALTLARVQYARRREALAAQGCELVR